MKLTYWYAARLNDADCYSIITKTKREAQHLVEAWGPDEYGPIEKRVIEYLDAFDLFAQVSSEGGGRSAGWTKGKLE